MLQKVFVVGSSGSGKTTAAKIIEELVPSIAQKTFHENLPVLRFKDYDILYKMYKEDKDPRFHQADYDGFEVLREEVFDEALEKLEGEITREVPVDYNGIVTIEFARNNYQHALSKFHDGFLDKAHLLFVDCEIDKCIRRIYARISNPPRPDFHFVPVNIMNSYFKEVNLNYMLYFGEDSQGDGGQHYKNEFPFLEKVKAVDNTNLSLDAFNRKVEHFAELVVESYVKECLIPS